MVLLTETGSPDVIFSFGHTNLGCWEHIQVEMLGRSWQSALGVRRQG